MLPYLLITGLLAATVLVLVAVWMASRRRLIGGAHGARLAAQWKAATAVGDPARRVLEAEKVLDGAMSVLGFAGTFGDKLKRAGPRFGNVQAVWDAHKLRNRIAHEAGIAVSDRDAKRATDAFARALKDVGVSVIG